MFRPFLSSPIRHPVGSKAPPVLTRMPSRVLYVESLILVDIRKHVVIYLGIWSHTMAVSRSWKLVRTVRVAHFTSTSRLPVRRSGIERRLRRRLDISEVSPVDPSGLLGPRPNRLRLWKSRNPKYSEQIVDGGSDIAESDAAYSLAEGLQQLSSRQQKPSKPYRNRHYENVDLQDSGRQLHQPILLQGNHLLPLTPPPLFIETVSHSLSFNYRVVARNNKDILRRCECGRCNAQALMSRFPFSIDPAGFLTLL